MKRAWGVVFFIVVAAIVLQMAVEIITPLLPTLSVIFAVVVLAMIAFYVIRFIRNRRRFF